MDKMKDKILIKNAIDRKETYLYYVDGGGNLCMCKFGMGDSIQSNAKFRRDLMKARDYFVENSQTSGSAKEESK